MTIQIDTREKPKAIQKILKSFDERNIGYFRSKLPVGDYMNLDNPRFVVDRKQNLFEMCNNVCQDHKRFVEELRRANSIGVKVVFLIEHGYGIKTLDDVQHWVNPRLKESPMAVSGQRLYKKLSVLEKSFDTQFLFCDKDHTGKRIVELLSGTVMTYGQNK